MPGVLTGGNGPVTGQEVLFNVNLSRLSTSQPITISSCRKWSSRAVISLAVSSKAYRSPGTPFPPGFTDLQSWTRDRCSIPIGFASDKTLSEELHSQHSTLLLHFRANPLLLIRQERDNCRSRLI